VGRPLVGDLVGLYSDRRGEYRIGYAIHDDMVMVGTAYVRRRADVSRSR
jgi:mRNA-degrading endonuclease RelE of RelBE toxin-antitoxin system